jgi:hypothetical protein
MLLIEANSHAVNSQSNDHQNVAPLSLGWMRNWHLCGLEDRGRPP